MSQLICKDLCLGYDGKVILENVNFELKGGEYLCIIGENGAGKSTLVKGLLKLKKPMSGDIITGEDLKAGEIGYLPQQTLAQKDFPASVMEVVLSGRLNKLGNRLFYNKKDKAEALAQMERLGISGLKDKCYHDLSGGQQQRVLLARALCATSKMLLLDEPVAGLDPLVTEEMYELIARINKEMGITIIMVSHDLEAALKYSSHILHLSHKQLFFGRTEDYVNLQKDSGGKNWGFSDISS